MQPFPHILTEISAAAAGSLIAAVWEGLVLAAVVAVCLRMLPGLSAAARSLVWSAAMVVVVLLPFLHVGSAVGGAAAAGWHLDERVGLALGCVWLAVSLFRAAQLVRSAVWLRGIARRAVPIEAGAVPGSRNAALCVSDEVDRPSVVGFFAPRILIPAWLLEKLEAGELEQIVLHEMEHLRRGDDWTNLLQKLSLVVFPLNPVLVWIERRLCLERELACDDSVLRATNARKAYAACLANLAEHSLVRRGVSLALGAWERRPELVRRVHRILFAQEREMSRRQVSFAVATMIFGLAGGADLLAHAPRVVSFGPVAPVTLAENAAMPYRVPGVRAQDVVFHPSAFPQGLKPRTPHAHNGTKVPHFQSARARVKASQPAVVLTAMTQQEAGPLPSSKDDSFRGGMMVLVTWRTVRTSVPDGDAIQVTTQSSQVSYAAVPTRNGWLIFQM